MFCYKRWRFESYRTEIPLLQLTFEIMRTEIPKLQKIFDAYSVHRAEAGAMHENQVTDEGRLGADLGCYRDWAQRIEAMYSSHTLCRMLYSTDSRTREAAAWGLGLVRRGLLAYWIALETQSLAHLQQMVFILD